jgi:hypothetical protein
MYIQSQPTGLKLPDAPEFGQDGSWPPVETEWVAVRWALFDVQATLGDFSPIVAHALALTPNDSSLPAVAPVYEEKDALSDDFLYEACFAHLTDVSIHKTAFRGILSMRIEYDPRSGRQKKEYPSINATELRRLVHYLRWRREDPPVKLPPAATEKRSYSVTTGLSEQRSQTLAESLGLRFGNNMAQLSSQLQQQSRLSVEITRQDQRTTELTLENPSNDGYRLFAVWHVDNLIKVDALSISFAADDVGPAWIPRGSTEFVTESNTHVTYAEVPRA